MDGLLLDSERLALETFKCTCRKFNLGDMSTVFIVSAVLTPLKSS